MAWGRGLVPDYQPSRGDLFLLQTSFLREQPLAFVGVPLRR